MTEVVHSLIFNGRGSYVLNKKYVECIRGCSANVSSGWATFDTLTPEKEITPIREKNQSLISVVIITVFFFSFSISLSLSFIINKEKVLVIRLFFSHHIINLFIY